MMAWTSEDQNPNLSPSAAYGGTNYAAQLNAAAYYNPMGSGTTMAPGSGTAAAQGGQSYADRLNAAAPAPEKETTSKALDKSAQRTIPANMSAYTDPYSTKGRARPPNQGVAIQAEAARLGIDPSDLAAVIGYETIGTFDPGIAGGKKNRYRGLIQMGPTERKAYGWRDGMSFEEQLFGPVHNYLVDRGVRPGHGIAELYSIINAGSLRRGQPRWGASDRPGWNVRRHVGEISRTYDPRYAYLDPGASTTQAAPETMMASAGADTLAGGNMPSPRQRPQRTDVSRAYAPAPEAMEGPFDAVMARSANRRPQPPTPRQRPQRDTLSAPQAPQPQAQGAYTVRRGDNLSKIAQRELGDANRWREIAAANRLRDPNVIRPGQKLVIPDSPTRTVDVPQPRLRPSREVDMPTPRPRPERGANVPTPRMRPTRGQPAPGFDTRRLDDAAGPRQPVPPRPGPLAEEPEVPWLERQFVNGKPRPGPVIPRTRLETAQLNYRRPDFSLVAGGNLGTPETRMSIDQTMRGGPPSPPAELGMDTSGLIREPTAEERAIQGGARMPLPTGAQPIDPAVAATIRRTPVVIVDPRSPPVYVSPSGVRIWATR